MQGRDLLSRSRPCRVRGHFSPNIKPSNVRFHAPRSHRGTVSPDKPAVIMASSGKVVTFRELDEESNRLAHLFRAAGLRPG